MPLPHFSNNYPMNKIQLIEPVVNDIIFSYNNLEILKMNMDGITITINGEPHPIIDNQDFIDSFNYIISDITGYENKTVLMDKLREQARQDILNEIGVSGQRLLKIEKILNTKKVKK